MNSVLGDLATGAGLLVTGPHKMGCDYKMR